MKRTWQRWQRIARIVGTVQARIIFTIFYFVLVSPIALIFKLLADPLQLRRREGSYWDPIPEDQDPATSTRKQS